MYKYLYEKHYDKYNSNVDRKIFNTLEALKNYLNEEVEKETLFNAGFNSAEIYLYRVEARDE